MGSRLVLAAVFSLALVSSSEACDITYDPKPTWEAMIDRADVVFVGEVVAMVHNDEVGMLARFRVDREIKGRVGPGAEVVTEMNSCTHSFGLGDRAIVAGNAFATKGGTRLYVATDSGWDPTVILGSPATPGQTAQLYYVNKLAEKQAAKGARQ